MRPVAAVLLAASLATAFLAGAVPAAASEPAPPAAAPETSVSFDPAREAGRIVDRLAAGEIDAVVARFDETVRAGISAEKLADIWRQVQAQAGAFRGREEAFVEEAEGYAVTSVPLDFERTSLVLRLSFNKKGEIAGLFFLPGRPRVEYRPPDYVKPDAFEEREVVTGSDGWPLPATLSMPAGKGPFPAVVLVHGSGPQDRDETVGGVKVFRDLAGGLASRGIAVLRYEKRTRVHPSKTVATVRHEVIDDAVAAVEMLRKTERIDPSRVFVLGHSLGGAMAPEIAKRSGSVAGIVSLAGSTRPLDEIIPQQVAYILESQHVPADERERQLAEVRAELAKIRRDAPAGAGEEELILGAPAAYWRDLLAHQPTRTARSLRIPILIVHGGRDYQVIEEDLAGWKKALAGRPNVEFKVYPKANHLFVEGEGASTPAEYDEPGNVAARVVSDLAEWIGRQAPPADKRRSR